MSSVTAVPSQQARFGFGAAAGAWGAAAGVALVVNLVFYALAHAVLGVPAKFQPLASPFFVVVYTVFGTLLATAMFALVLRLSRRSPTVFRSWVAAAVFVIGLTAFLLGPAGSLPVVLLTSVVAAVLAFILVGGVATRPLAAFQLLAILMLLVSFVFPLNMLVGPAASFVQSVWDPNGAMVATLMVMHVVTAVAVVGAITIAMQRAGLEGLWGRSGG